MHTSIVNFMVAQPSFKLRQFVVQLIGFTGCILRAFAFHYMTQSADDAIRHFGHVMSVMIRYQYNGPVLSSKDVYESQLAPHPDCKVLDEMT